jgi:Fe-S-cluster containining protein
MSDSTFKLLTIYNRLPTLACKGLCHEACGPIHVSPVELERMQAIRPLPPGTIHGDLVRGTRTYVIVSKNQVCPQLDPKTKRCLVYEARPLICRAYGAVTDLRCEHGCVPSKPMSKGEFLELAQELESIQPSPAPRRNKPR